MIRIVILLLIIVFIGLIGAFFATPDFTMPCSEKLLSCLQSAYSEPFMQRMLSGLKCVFSNVWCVFTQFKGIF